MFIGTLSFGSYRAIVLGPQQPLIEKIAPLVVHSTNLTTDVSRLFFLVVLYKPFPVTWSFFSCQTRVSNNVLLKKVSSMSRSIIWSAGAKRLLYC